MFSLDRKKTIILLIVVCLIGCLTACASTAKPNQSRNTVSFASQTKSNTFKPKILVNYKRIKDTNSPLETNFGTYKGEKSAILNSKSKLILKAFNVNYENIKNVKIVKDNDLDRIFYRANIDNALVDIDKDGNIVNYTNNHDMSNVEKNRHAYKNEPLKTAKYKINFAKDLNSIISNLTSVIDLNGYKEVNCSNDIAGAWLLDWNKDLGNGITNPYDVVVVTIDAKDGSVWLFSRDQVTPNTTVPIVTKDQAIKFAQSIISKAKNIKVSLTFFKPNFYWEKGGPYKHANFVRLAWKVTLKNGSKVSLNNDSIVMVDAETGEILGGNQTM